MKCDLCGQTVKIVGDTTKYYEGMERLKVLKECWEISKNAYDRYGYSMAEDEIKKVIIKEFGKDALK